MNYEILPEPEVLSQRIGIRRTNPDYRFPSVSVFMPFDPKMGMKNKLTLSLSKAMEKVIGELKDKFPGEMSLLVIQKLEAIIKSLDFNTYKKSIAIFVSPVFEKIYYLNIDIEEKVIVSESLQIRDLVYSKKQPHISHILFLSDKESRIYRSDTCSSLRIKPDTLISKNTCQNDEFEQIANFSGSAMKEGSGMKKFLHQVDHSLDIILKQDRLPVFVMGNKNLVEQFRSINKSNKAIIAYVYGDFAECSVDDLKKSLKSQIVDWQKIKQKNLLDQLKEAANKNKLSFGMEDVRNEVTNQRGRLLLVGKKYLFDSGLCEVDMPKDKMARTYHKFSCIKNSIDEIIEKVLEIGGDVEFVDHGLLTEYDQIALIRF